jgi:hypothetical protein
MIAGSEIDYASLASELSHYPTKQAMLQATVDAPFIKLKVEMAMLFLGFISFFLVDEAHKKVYLAGTSDTEHYHLSVKDYPFDPKKFRLDLNDKKNHIVQAIVDKKVVHNNDWGQVSRPEAAVETVRLNQATSGISAVYIYPLTGKKRGALMYNFFQFGDGISKQQLEFMRRYTDMVSAAVR